MAEKYVLVTGGAAEILAWPKDALGWHISPEGIHVRIGKEVEIGEDCLIEDRLELGDNCRVGPRCSIDERCQVGPRCRIDSGCWLGPRCSVGPDCWLRTGCLLEAGCRLGAGLQVAPLARLKPDDAWLQHTPQEGIS